MALLDLEDEPMTDFTAPQFCIGFDGEADPIVWGDRDPANVVKLPKPAKVTGTQAHRATEAEQWAYGVELRIVGSKWRRQMRAPHYPDIEAYKGPYKTPEHIAHKAAHTRALGTPKAAAQIEKAYYDWFAQRPVADERIAA